MASATSQTKEILRVALPVDGQEDIAVMELPAAHFGKTSFKPGDSIEFSSTRLTHGEAYRMDWQGCFQLGE